MVDRSGRLGLGFLIAALVLCACNSAPIDKSGKLRHDVVSLRMALPEAGAASGTTFAAALAARSSGRLKVEIDSAAFDSSDPALELRAVGAVRSGAVDLALVPGRDWAQEGDVGFQAVMAPFAVTTLGATLALVANKTIEDDLLNGLAPLGVQGIALVAGEPRHLLTRRPMFGPSLRGARVRVVDNSATAALITALDGVPIQGLTAQAARAQFASGNLDGAETAPTPISANSYNNDARYLSAYAVIPRVDALVANTATWTRLTPTEQKAVRQAAADTASGEAARLAIDEPSELSTLCANGLIVDEVPLAVLQAMERAVRGLAPTSQRALAVSTLIHRELPGLGAQTTAVEFPSECHIARTPGQAFAQARRVDALSDTAPFMHRGGSSIPVGTYVTTVTPEDFHSGGSYYESDRAVRYTMTFRADGSFLTTQVPDYPDQGPLRARYHVTGSWVRFQFVPASGLTPETVKWSYFDGQLTFSIVTVQDPASRVIYLAHPWRRVH